MKLATVIFGLLLLISMHANAQPGTLTKDAYEVRLGTVRLPQTESSSIAFRKCDNCDYISRFVTPATRWTLNNRSVSFREFQDGLRNVADRNNKYITIVHDLETDRITEVVVTLRD